MMEKMEGGSGKNVHITENGGKVLGNCDRFGWGKNRSLSGRASDFADRDNCGIIAKDGESVSVIDGRAGFCPHQLPDWAV